MLPHDQKIVIKGDNPQLFLIIPSEILKVVHQEILNIFVNLNWHKTSQTDLTMQLNTSLIFAELQIWLSTLSWDTPDLFCITEFYHWLQKSTSFSPFPFSNCYLTGLFFLLFCTLDNFAHFFSSFLLFILAPISLQITSGHPSSVIFWRGIKEQQAATPLCVLFPLFTLIYLLMI